MSDKKKKKNSPSKEVSYKHKCTKCGYDNTTTLNWPIKIYNNTKYKFRSYCTSCGKEYSYEYKEELPAIEENTVVETNDVNKE